VPQNLSRHSGTLPGMASPIAIENDEWALVQDLFDPPGRRGAPARHDRREIVDAILFLARTGCRWRHLPDRHPHWEAVWQQRRRWRDGGVCEQAMARLAHVGRARYKRKAQPSMVMINCATGCVKPVGYEAAGCRMTY
jgi:transposase